MGTHLCHVEVEPLSRRSSKRLATCTSEYNRVDVPYMRHLSICLSNFFQVAAADVKFCMHIHHTSAYIDK